MKNIIVFGVSFIGIVIIFFLSFFIKIRVGRLYSGRVGHLCLNLDNYIFNKKNSLNINWAKIIFFI